MIKLSTAPARLALLVGFFLVGTTAAADAASSRYHGTTSQGRRMSLVVTGHLVSRFGYFVQDRCPGGRSLYVRTTTFPTMEIKHGRFGGRFQARPPQHATVVVEGTLNGRMIKGSISDRTEDRSTQAFCSGKVRFQLKRQ